jgi:hypothetical protein
MKRQLTDFHQQTQRNFGFRTILCSFFLREFLALVLEKWYADIRPLFLLYVDGQYYCCDRVV